MLRCEGWGHRTVRGCSKARLLQVHVLLMESQALPMGRARLIKRCLWVGSDQFLRRVQFSLLHLAFRVKELGLVRGRIWVGGNVESQSQS